MPIRVGSVVDTVPGAFGTALDPLLRCARPVALGGESAVP